MVYLFLIGFDFRFKVLKKHAVKNGSIRFLFHSLILYLNVEFNCQSLRLAKFIVYFCHSKVITFIDPPGRVSTIISADGRIVSKMVYTSNIKSCLMYFENLTRNICLFNSLSLNLNR